MFSAGFGCPVMLFGVMVPVRQIFQMLFEGFVVHRKRSARQWPMSGAFRIDSHTPQGLFCQSPGLFRLLPIHSSSANVTNSPFRSDARNGLKFLPKKRLVSHLRFDVTRFVDFAIRTFRHKSGVGSSVEP